MVERLNAELNNALRDPKVLAELGQQGAEALGGSPEEYATYLAREIDRWGQVVKQTGITLD